MHLCTPQPHACGGACGRCPRHAAPLTAGLWALWDWASRPAAVLHERMRRLMQALAARERPVVNTDGL